MNLTQLLGHIGLGDGQGNTSIMRVLVALIVLSVLAPAVFAAFHNHANLTLTADNLEVIAGALGFKCVQNAQENSQPVNKPTQ